MAAVMLAASACGNDEEAAEVVPVPQVATTTSTTVPEPTTTTTEPEVTTTTAYDWGPVLCPGVPHPAHHEPCVGTRARATDSPLADSPPRAQREEPAYTPIRASSDLASIRECESGGDYSAVSPGGQYRGAYQFDSDTWAAAGGSGDPADASPAEQDARAQSWIDQGNRGAWPNC